MAKKAVEVKNSIHTHKECGWSMEIKDEFLNYNGEPIMGVCIWCNTRFILNEKLICKKFWKNNAKEK